MAVRVHAELLLLAPSSGVIEVHQEAIAQAMTPSVSVKSVYRALQDLVAAGCIEYDRIGNRPNEYRVIRDLASTRIVISELMRSRSARGLSDMSEEMSEGMSGVSGAEGLNGQETASIGAITPMSGAAGDTQPIRARVTSSSSWSSSGSDTAVMSETNARVLRDPKHLKVAGLIKSAHIDPTREACEAMALLTESEQFEALRRAMKATDPNPVYLAQCCQTVLRLRGANELPSVLPLLYPERFQDDPDPIPFDACDELSPGEPATSSAAANAEPRQQASTESEGVTPSTVRGVTPRAGSTPPHLPTDRVLFRIAQGLLLRAARIDAGMDQRDAAAATNGLVGKSALSTYETGSREASAIVLVALAAVYRVGLDSLIPSTGGAA